MHSADIEAQGNFKPKYDITNTQKFDAHVGAAAPFLTPQVSNAVILWQGVKLFTVFWKYFNLVNLQEVIVLYYTFFRK